MKYIGFILTVILLAFDTKAQPGGCILKPPQYTIHFGAGIIKEPNTAALTGYRRVSSSCPSDGHYSFVPSTSRCFNDDWHTLTEDHTPGDVNGNMLVVNASPYGGTFLNMPIPGLKSNTSYELGMWLMNLCRPSDKCPTILLPNLKIILQTPEGKIIAHIVTRDLPRVETPAWTQHRVYFTTSTNNSILQLVMMDNAPGGCGNDFAVDDITFRECVKQELPPATTLTKKPLPVKASNAKPTKKLSATTPKRVQRPESPAPKKDTAIKTVSVIKSPQLMLPPPPPVLKNRENALLKRIETTAGKINIDLYDNGVIDGDTVSIYHNNALIKSKQLLSQKPISLTIQIDPTQPHHELIMVAENLGSIPPNTSIMIINTPDNRYRVSITSSEQKNARVVFELKQ